MQTIAQRRPFDITQIDEDEIAIKILSTGKPRHIPRADIEGAWQELVRVKHIDRKRIRPAYNEVSPVYILAMLAQLPGVHVSVDRTLVYDKTES